jgi:hypothetical protein
VKVDQVQKLRESLRSSLNNSSQADIIAALEEQGFHAKASQLRGRIPQIPETLRWAWMAFQELSRRRSFGGLGVNPISYQEISAYCTLRKLRHDDDIADLVFFVSELDDEYMKFVAESSKDGK